MKTLLTISTLVFTLMFSSTSFAEWTKMGEDVDSGTTYYVDFERMRKHGGHVYYWELFDFIKPREYGELSTKIYVQGDCKLFRFKSLSYSFHKEPMGGGTGNVITPKGENADWSYISPITVEEIFQKKLCSR